jgi:kinesin family protein 6/9
MHEGLPNLPLAGAGKTYTMAGNRASYAGRGLIPRCIAALLSRLGSAPGLASWSVVVSYLEIYNESLYDLLDLTAQPHELSLYEDGWGRVQVGGGASPGVRQ